MNERYCISVVKNIVAMHDKIVRTPRARTPESIKAEIQEFKEYCGYLKWGGEITDKFYKEIIEQIDKLDWNNMAQQRQQLKRTLRR